MAKFRRKPLIFWTRGQTQGFSVVLRRTAVVRQGTRVHGGVHATA